jgi:hypothetical protein
MQVIAHLIVWAIALSGHFVLLIGTMTAVRIGGLQALNHVNISR